MNKGPTVSFVVDASGNAVDLLAGRAGLPKARIKDAMSKGAVWLRKARRKDERRLRRAKTVLQAGDHVAL